MELFASLVEGELLVEARGAEGVLRLDWSGRSNGRRPGRCSLRTSRRCCCARGPTAVHRGALRAVEFFDSSTVGAVIGFIRAAREHSPVDVS